MSEPAERLCYTVEQFMGATGLSRNRVYEAISSGALRSFLDGRRRRITAQAARDFVADLEAGAGLVPSPMSGESKDKLRRWRATKRQGAA